MTSRFFSRTSSGLSAFCLGFAVAGLGVAIWASAGSQPLSAEESGKPASQKPADPKDALAELNDLIGGWRGAGMPRRGSNAGAWFETAEWIWDFEKKTPALKYNVTKGELLDTARLTWDSKKNQFHLEATLPDERTRRYTGRLNEAGKLVLESKADEDGTSHRITITRLNEKRTLVLYQKRSGKGLYRRVAEVGYTRQGTSLAEAGAGELECIVTGGQGTIPVRYKGKTYYVCCTGCQQAFDDDPAGIVAAYEQKLKDRKAENSD